MHPQSFRIPCGSKNENVRRCKTRLNSSHSDCEFRITLEKNSGRPNNVIMSATYDATSIKPLLTAIVDLLKPAGRNNHLPRGVGSTRTEYKDGRAAAAIGQLGPSPTSYANRGNEKGSTALPPLEPLAESVAATQKQVETSVVRLFGGDGKIPPSWSNWPTSMIGTEIKGLDEAKQKIEDSDNPLSAEMYKAELDYVRVAVLDEGEVGEVHAQVGHTRRIERMEMLSIYFVCQFGIHQAHVLVKVVLQRLGELAKRVFQPVDGRAVQPGDDGHQRVKILQLSQILRQGD